MDDLYTIKKTNNIVFKEKNSKFIAYAYRVNNIKEINFILKNIKEKEPKATHYCYAYRIGFNNQSKSFDDGEPAGTAGKPILGQIYHFKLTNILVVVIRYFGGVLLGTSGLIKSYKKASHDVLNDIEYIKIELQQLFSIKCDYININYIIYILKKYDVDIINKDFNDNCFIIGNINISKYEELEKELLNKKNIELKKKD